MDNIKINFSEKYVSKNLISRRLVNKFSVSLAELMASVNFKKMLDVGCGEGVMLKQMEKIIGDRQCYAIDLEQKNIDDARINFPQGILDVGTVYNIKFDDNSFDLVTCLEVLEHLDEPGKALKELHRVTNKYAILSVPREPLWRFLNMCRFKYWNALGNTPDHVNHWSQSSFKEFISPFFNIVTLKSPIPWTMVLCEKI